MSEAIRGITRCLCNGHYNHVDCDVMCTTALGCTWPIRPVSIPPLIEPTPEHLERLREGLSGPNARRLRLIPHVDTTITGPALHETQARAYALIAAASMPWDVGKPGAFSSPAALALWRHHVLNTADIFTQYITTGQHKPTPSGSEDS